jgi:hypothetical protein
MKTIHIKHTENVGATPGHPHTTPDHPHTTPDHRSRVTIYEITDIPDHVAIADVLWLFDRTATIGERYSYRYDELRESRIIRD